MNIEDIEKLLEVYSLEDILELNELTEVDLLLILIENELIELPETLPL